MYGAISYRKERFFRTYLAGFNTGTFIRYVREVHRRFGKIAMILDRATPHRSKRLKEEFGGNKDVVFVCLPKESPYPGVMDEYWRLGKYNLQVSEHCPGRGDCHPAVSEYYGTTGLRPGLYKYLDRWPSSVLTNFYA